MPLLSCCSAPGLLGSAALVALILWLPAQDYLPGRLGPGPEMEPALTEPSAPEPPPFPWRWPELTADVVLTALLVLVTLLAHLGEWVQRKVLERRIVALRDHLVAPAQSLADWEARQERLAVSLRVVRNATAEYELLLWLLLKQRQSDQSPPPPTDHSLGGKQLDTDFFGLGAYHAI